MQLQAVDRVDNISELDFQEHYYKPMKPLVINDLSKNWPAYHKWNWQFFKDTVGSKQVALYNNVKSDAYTPINTADDYKTFGQYVDMISQGPAGWRIFLFNIFDHAPQLVQDFTWPDHLMRGFVKRFGPRPLVGTEVWGAGAWRARPRRRPRCARARA